MTAQKISINLVGVIWAVVGFCLSTAGIKWILQLGLTPLMIFFLTCSIVIGLLKGKFILQKVAAKYCKRAEKIKFKDMDVIFGWIKVFGVKGFVLIAIMAVTGSLLRHSTIDRPILGVIYLAVGIALVYASKIFFVATREV